MKQNNLDEILQLILNWFLANERKLPWREDTDPYHVWVSEIMLQQTRIEAVIPYYDRFMKRLPDIRSLAECDDEELHKLWEGLGYYSRVRNLKKAALIICEEYDGSFPRNFEDIRALPGIGDYTAGAIASIAYDQPRAAVDGNVLRVLSRIKTWDTDVNDLKFRKQVTALLEEAYPAQNTGKLTQGLMELGEVICIPNGIPACDSCPVKDLCQARLIGRQSDFPVKSSKAPRRREDYLVYRITVGNRILLHKRPETGLLAGLWEYPNIRVEEYAGNPKTVENAGDARTAENTANPKMTHNAADATMAGLYLRKLLPALPEAVSLVMTGHHKHVFTHIEWEMDCYELALPEAASDGIPSEYTAVTAQELKEIYTLPTAFLKLWKL